MKPKLSFVALVAVTLLGCSSAPVTQSGTGSPTSSSKQGGTPASLEVPEELRNEAYSWYGLNSDKPMNVQVKTGPRTLTGVQTVRLKEVKPGKAIFEIVRDGDLLSLFGTETLALEKDGIYTIKSTEFEGNVRNLEMPTDLTPGKTWDNNGKFKRANGEDLTQKLSFKVVGPQKVTTALGSQDALYITSFGSMSSSGSRFQMNSSFWYVKNKGLVKMIIKMKNLTDVKAQPQEILYQETK
jgi:hypothetical protein